MKESVWDYPRPPRLEPSPRRVRVEFAGQVVAESVRAVRVLETSHPPGWYIPPEDATTSMLVPNPRTTLCEFKGVASYWDVVAGDSVAHAAAWSYPAPASGYEAIRAYVAFYPGAMDSCWVDDEQVSAQASSFYGGWITSDVSGPFKTRL